MHADPSENCSSSISREQRAVAKEVNRSVVHEMPNADTDDAILALVHLRCLDNLLLKSSWKPPVDHMTRVLHMIGTCYEASIMRSETSSEHACTPWPPCMVQRLPSTMELVVVKDFYASACMESLFLAWIRDLRDWMHDQFRRSLTIVIFADNAAVVAVANGENVTIAPNFSLCFAVCRPSSHLEVSIHVNPFTTARSLLAQHILWHEVI
mmetsp:Transcript_76230/g.120350  ORF Transcript_76230/g.120350 Transcript_76230/m.120350 type:complete len:210 (+) Transcript_76230:185-814(+)